MTFSVPAACIEANCCSCCASLCTATGVEQEQRVRMHDHGNDVLNEDILCARHTVRNRKSAFVLGALTTGAISTGKHRRVCMPTGMDMETHCAYCFQ